MQTVGLVAAMPQEGKALLKQVGGWEKLTIGGFRAYRFTESGWECRLIESGMGAKRAADATRALIKAGRPQLLISFGIAGAVEEDLQIGDVVAAESTCMLQGNELTAVQPLGKVTQPAWEAISAALKKEGVRLFRGTAITTRGSQWTGWQPGRPEHPVLEMETAGILHAAQENGVPLVVLRAISDGPAAPIPFDLASMMDEDYNLRIGRIIGAILRRPNLLRQALRMGKNSEIAARNAAMAVEVLLSFQVPIR
jgi:adenosylhomocysteine nucleosidase